MATYSKNIRRSNKKQEIQDYGFLMKGCTNKIPIEVKLEDESVFNLTPFSVAFTLKKDRTDELCDDESALIVKDFDPQAPNKGRFYIHL